MAYSQLPFASIKNDFLQVDYLTEIGPRIIGLYVNGLEDNLLAETPDVHWATPHGEFYLLGGHRLWTAPEDPFYTCPDGQVHVSVDNDTVALHGAVDAAGLEKEMSIHLDGNRVHVSHQVTWHGEQPIQFAPWGITQLRLGGMAILPLSNAKGLLPNRNLVLWEYTKLDDKRLELYDDVLLLHGSASEQACKIGNRNSHGWVAYALGDALFIKRFTMDNSGSYPDMDCNVEAYVKDVCLELESLGSLQVLQPGDSLKHTETWEVLKGKYPPTLATVRKVCETLS
jgi:hypothetical protein